MSQLLIPDAGPLFSLAAGNLLPLLARFRVGISDVVREETIDRGLGPQPSIEAQRLLVHYNQHATDITTFQTQVGIQVALARSLDPNYKTPVNMGELSIQSLLIELQIKTPNANPVILFEDGWFLNNAPAFAKPCVLLSTQAFLEYAEEKGWTASAEQARKAISQTRPNAYSASMQIRSTGSAP